MTKIGDVSLVDLRRELCSAGLILDCGGVLVRVRSTCASLALKLQCVYGAFPFQSGGAGFADVTVSLEPARGWRNRWREHIRLVVDGEVPFEDLPAATDLPMLEWGVNWCVAHRAHHRLLLHAGVVERDGYAMVLPALPGSGKSTLTAGLASRGWRLFSDEFGAVDPSRGHLVPMLRPIALKNESIAIIRSFAPNAVLGPEFPGTRKGTVAHVAPDEKSVSLRHVPAQPLAVVFPKFERAAQPSVEALPGAFTFVKLAGNSFNYGLLGPVGFSALRRLVNEAPSYRIHYGTLEQAIELVEGLHDDLLAEKKRKTDAARSAASCEVVLGMA